MRSTLLLLLVSVTSILAVADDTTSQNPPDLETYPKENLHASAEDEEDFAASPPQPNTESAPAEKTEGNKSSDEAAAQGKRLWGSSPSGSNNHAIPSTNEDDLHQQDSAHQASASQHSSSSGSLTKASSTVEDNATKVLPLPSANIPFVATSKPGVIHHPPPDGFRIAARVYLDPYDRQAHFDDKSHSLPYWDCGITGATTSPLPLKNAFFRQALASAATSWTEGKHPVLAVALSPMIMELNSGASRTFEAGEVILLEDVLMSGHRMRSVGVGDLKILFLTLPQQHYHAGKEYYSLNMFETKTLDPCPNDDDENNNNEEQSKSKLKKIESQGIHVGWTARRIRTIILASIGLSVSTLAADFLGKTAPLWLAVGVGGTCFVGGSTYALTVAGDKLLTAIELWNERRRLNAPEPDSAEEEAEAVMQVPSYSTSLES